MHVQHDQLTFSGYQACERVGGVYTVSYCLNTLIDCISEGISIHNAS